MRSSLERIESPRAGEVKASRKTKHLRVGSQTNVNCIGTLVPSEPSGAARSPMKIATCNVNGVNGRLPVLLRWLKESKPGIVCLQELKAPQEKFPEEALNAAGYKAIWHGQKICHLIQRGNDPRSGESPSR